MGVRTDRPTKLKSAVYNLRHPVFITNSQHQNVCVFVSVCVRVVRRSEDANRSFSAAVQLHDSLVKAWALWGDYLDQLFTSDRFIIIILLYKCIFDQ